MSAQMRSPWKYWKRGAVGQEWSSLLRVAGHVPLALVLTVALGIAMPVTAFAQSQPVITSFTPSTGPAGTVITVAGSGFTGATVAKVSWADDAELTVVSDSEATITVPTDAPLGADTLAIGNDTNTGYSATGFTVTSPVPQPVITSFTPSTGPAGTAITVTGSGFTGATYAKVGYADDAGISVVSDTQATITVPTDAPLGAQVLAIGNASYMGNSSSSFTVTSAVPQPVITSFTPSGGSSGTIITVTGSGFTGATYAKVGYADDAGITVVSDTQVKITVPTDAPLGAQILAVGNASYMGNSASSFTVTSPVPQPVITSFTPSTGSAGTTITVTGSGFTGATYAKVGYANDAAISVVSDTQATITVPSDAPLGADILAVGNASYLGNSASSFTVTSPVPQPVISSFTPSSGATGTVITVTGSGFTGATFAKVSWADDAGISVTSDTQATITVPADAPLGNDTLAIGNTTYSGYSVSSFTVTSSSGGDTTPPTTPTGLTSSAASSSQINLGWTASTDNVGVTDYIIQRCTGSSCSDFADIGTSSTTSYSDTGLAASTSYSYQVQAADAAGNLSGFSNTSSTTTQSSGSGSGPPTTPTGLSASATSSSQISLSWTASTDSGTISGYLVERCQGSGCTAFSQIGTSTGSGYLDAGLIPTTSYSYRVRAADTAGNISAYSNIASATTASGTNGYVYDTHGRLYSVTTFSGTMYYHYDAAGNLTSVTSSP